MLALGRLIVVGFVVLSILYVIISVWSRLTRRRKLIRAWEAEGRPGDRDEYLRKGLEDYDDSLRPKLILLVYIVPVVVVALIIYLTNFH
jgi:hypothetical protein